MNIIRILLKEALLLLILFNLGRFLFLVGYGSLNSFHQISELISHSFRLDFATIAECLTLFFLSIILRPILTGKITFLITKYTSILLAILLSLIYAGEITTYEEWGGKLNYKVFIHLGNPTEIFQTSSFGQMLLFALVFATIFGVYVILRKSKFLGFRQLHDSITAPIIGLKKNAFTVAQFVVLLPVLLAIMRGGIQPIPINLSSAYYSTDMVNNDAAVNSLWSLGYSLSENYANFDNRNPFKFQDNVTAQAIVDKIHSPVKMAIGSDSIYKETPISIFKFERPNIVLLILESWSANVISSMNGPSSLTPNFDNLVKDGLLFTEFHASGYTSDLAMPAIFSSFHALPVASIVTQPSKVKHLPSLARHLNNNGYSTSFYFGGQLYYGNIKSYLMLQEFQKIVEENDLSPDLPRGRLGIHDEYLFDIHQRELAEMASQQPFFSALFTLSSHAPYDMPAKSVQQYDEEYNPYLNSVHYTDSCLGVYFTNLRSQPFYENTIFIITGDHGHYAPKSGNKFSKGFNQIPLLIYGPALKDSLNGLRLDHLSSQVDLAPTLLSQLGIPIDKFKWGKNILDPGAPQFAYYSGPNSISWIRPYGYFAYENRFERFMHLELKDSLKRQELIEEGKAYGQMVFQDYLDY